MFDYMSTLATEQARLPLRRGGFGLTSAVDSAPAALLGGQCRTSSFLVRATGHSIAVDVDRYTLSAAPLDSISVRTRVGGNDSACFDRVPDVWNDDTLDSSSPHHPHTPRIKTFYLFIIFNIQSLCMQILGRLSVHVPPCGATHRDLLCSYTYGPNAQPCSRPSPQDCFLYPYKL